VATKILPLVVVGCIDPEVEVQRLYPLGTLLNAFTGESPDLPTPFLVSLASGKALGGHAPLQPRKKRFAKVFVRRLCSLLDWSRIFFY
jgi:hypothetical protein